MRHFLIGLVMALSSVSMALAQARAPQPPARAAQPPARAAQPPASPSQPSGARQAPAAQGAPSGAAAAQAAEEQAIRKVIDGVTKAYNDHDANALAAYFTTDAELVDEDGDVTQSRAAIEGLFSDVFEAFPQAKMDLDVTWIRFLGPGVAIEEGLTKIVHQPGTPPEQARYSVVHVKQDGKWQIASSRDVADVTLRGSNELEQLGWLVGDWIDESPDALVKTSFRWTDNHKFLLGEFTLQIGGRPALTGNQRIGWDPLAKQLRSWVFDSEGGFGEGLWSVDGDQWTVKLSAVTRDGQVGSSTNQYERVAPDSFIFESHDRMVGDERMEDSGLIRVVRVPPKPGEPAN